MPLKLIFLDIDGVLNDHTLMRSGYCTIHTAMGDRLNDILDAVPDAQVVVSSAWRYLITGGHMTVTGFENMLQTYGLKVYKRVHGHTRMDTNADECRSVQIYEYLDKNFPDGRPPFVVLDDLDLPMPELIKTHGSYGLQKVHVRRVIAALQPSPEVVGDTQPGSELQTPVQPKGSAISSKAKQEGEE